MNTFSRLSGKTALMGASGEVTSLQVGVFGEVTDLSTADFSLADSHPFSIKNDGDDTVTLEVMPVNGSAWVSTKFFVGWNPELVKAIKLNETVGLSLKYGY